ncbi:sugar transferase [Subtercola boreus]|uniref:sugar transferase n=1 Tax=Subtercola boreus TaxID=120213 RepID=UPI00209BDA86|nr:sugar transferase [Subtercola boreus]
MTLTEGTATSREDWRSAYASRLRLTDLLVIAAVVITTQVVWFGFDRRLAVTSGWLPAGVQESILSIVVIVAWFSILSLYSSRGDRIIGTGSSEYRVVVDASFRLFGLFALVAFLFQIEFSRGYFVIAFPAGTVALVLGRWVWRKWLSVHRARGEYSAQVVLVGSVASVLHTARELKRQPQAGYHVIGACVPDSRRGSLLPGSSIPVVGGVEEVLKAMQRLSADTVIITSSDDLPADRIRELSWSLEPGRQHLVVAPSLTDIGGPRIHTRPVSGLPLIHVEMPRYEGFKRYQKRAFDILSSSALIAVLSPVLLVLALAVRFTSPGAVLFRQKRVGLNGSSFYMLKFRSMVNDAEALLATLELRDRAEGNSILFKMKDDPRITPIGKILRRFSLDELPQLFNVFIGNMSLVGPRPPLQKEVELYETHVHRRFLMKPGITGLWQVSGRSDLSWEDSVRLDLYYVENWSMINDFVILLKTAKAVVSSSGAY